MKLEIYESKEKVKKEEPVRLALRQEGKKIKVVVVDEFGVIEHCGVLLSFTESGNIDIHPQVNKNFGFQLNNHGQIKIGGE